MDGYKIHRCIGSSIIYFSLRIEQKRIPSRFLRPEYKKKKYCSVYVYVNVRYYICIYIFLIIIHLHTPDK